MRYISIDLEIEQPFTNIQCPDSKASTQKLIQVGIVVFELAGGEPTILHSETMNIFYPLPLSTFIKTLTSISDEDVNNASDFPIDALRRLSDLRGSYDTSRQIVEWGSGDTTFLLEQAGVTQSDFNQMYGFARSTINVKVLFQCYALANEIKTKGGLSKSMNKLGLQFQGTRYKGKNKGCHWAEADALNTARVYNELINLMRRNVITLSEGDFDKLQKELDNPSPKNDKFIEAMSRHKEKGF